jgi:hypothetical protein
MTQPKHSCSTLTEKENFIKKLILQDELLIHLTQSTAHKDCEGFPSFSKPGLTVFITLLVPLSHPSSRALIHLHPPLLDSHNYIYNLEQGFQFFWVTFQHPLPC